MRQEAVACQTCDTPPPLKPYSGSSVPTKIEPADLYLQIVESQVCQSTRFNKLAPVCGTVQGEPPCTPHFIHVYMSGMRCHPFCEIVQMRLCN